MPDALRFIPSDYPGGRILLRCGMVDVGAVFPPSGLALADSPKRQPWRWIFWLRGSTAILEGKCSNEQDAKGGLLRAFRRFLTEASLEVTRDA